MALTQDEQDLLDFALAALPHWFQDDERQAEFLGGAAKTMGAARAILSFWKSQTLIQTAIGPVLTTARSFRIPGATNHAARVAGIEAGLDLTTAFTLEAWIFLDIANLERTILAKSDVAGTDLSVEFSVETGNRLRLLVSRNGTTYDTAMLSDSTIPDQEWHHVAVTYDTTTAIARFYVDGQPGGVEVGTSGTLATTTAKLTVGNDASFDRVTFTGYLDLARVWSLVRSDAEILTNFKRLIAADTTGLAAQYNFEGDFVDTSGNGNTLELFGSTAGPANFSETVPFVLAVQPDWLALHAADRNTFRQDSEEDPALRLRLRNVPDAVNRVSLLSAAQELVDDAGISGTVGMVELKRDGAFFGTSQSDTGTGGLFTKISASNVTFQPATQFAGPPFRSIEPTRKHRLVLSGAATAANNGSFIITGLSGNAAIYANASGVTEDDAVVTWTVEKLDRDDNLLDGFPHAFLDRGFRLGELHPVIIMILPEGCPTGLVNSVREMLRQKKGGGVLAFVECVPPP